MAERKTTKKPRTRAAGPARKTKPAMADLEAAVRTLTRRLKQAEAALEAARTKHERQIASTKRAADRQLAAMMREITTLRYHEARAEALERILAEREATIAALQIPTDAPTDGADAVGERESA